LTIMEFKKNVHFNFNKFGYKVAKKLRIRQIARERGIDLQVQGLVCLPRELNKYTGSVARYQKSNVTFETAAEAEQYVHETNLREGLPIRNRFTIFVDQVLVELPGNKLQICNYEDLYLVEMHTWCCANGYAVTHTSASTTQQCFHNMVMKHLPSEITVDHINRNGLDNHKSNLRLVDQRIQSINRGCQVNNKSGVTGVCFDKKAKCWVATWKDAKHNQCSKWYSSKKYGIAEA